MIQEHACIDMEILINPSGFFNNFWKHIFLHILIETFVSRTTPLKISMEPKIEGLEDFLPFQTGDFQVLCEFSRV